MQRFPRIDLEGRCRVPQVMALIPGSPVARLPHHVSDLTGTNWLAIEVNRQGHEGNGPALLLQSTGVAQIASAGPPVASCCLLKLR